MKNIIIIALLFLNLSLYAQTTYVPDDNFEQALIDKGYDTGPLDDYVPTANISGITSLQVSQKDISDLTGIEDFLALETFWCSTNNLSSIDISSNTLLVELHCSGNQLTSLNVSSNTLLVILNCASNQLTGLNVTSNLLLENLYCSSNQLTSLDLSVNTALTELYCSQNEITGLNLSSNTALTLLSCEYNLLTSLNLSTNTALQTLSCDYNDLAALDLSSNTAIVSILCQGNNLSSLDLSSNTLLETLMCHNNELESLDLSDNVLLIYLFGGGNQFTSLNLSANTALTYVTLGQGELTELDLRNGNNAAITTFYADYNPNLICIFVDDKTAAYLSGWGIDEGSHFVNNETECNSIVYTYVPDDNFEQALIDLGYDTGPLDDYVPTENINSVENLDVNSKSISDLTGIENFTALTQLYCTNNQLTSLDLTSNTALIALNCRSNDITSLNLSSNTLLYWLRCGDNPLNGLDLSDNTALKTFYCIDNGLTSLDLSSNTLLETLVCYDNQITNLNLSFNTVLEVLACNNNQLTSLDLSNNTELAELTCDNNLLTSLDMRNGNNANVTIFNANNNTALPCIYVDDKDAAYLSGWTIDPASTFVNNEAECSSLSVSDQINKGDIQIFPNPAKHQVFIDFNDIVVHNIYITDLTGKLILEKTNINKQQETIKLSDLKPGICILHIKTQNEVLVYKLIKE